MMQQFSQSQVMQAQLKQHMVGGQPLSPQQQQQMMANPQQPGNQAVLNQVRSPPTSLSTTVRSPQPIPSPRQPNPVLSPLGQTASPHTGMTGPPQPHGVPNDNHLNTDQVMLSQRQNSLANQDMTSVMGHNEGDVTPLTPQDQLSRFVDNL